MKIALTPGLQAQRRGRFLASLLAIPAWQEAGQGAGLPDTGLALMAGEQLQASAALQSECADWARQAGRALLLLPPYQEGPILPFLDWSIGFASGPPPAGGPDSVPQIVAQEIMHSLQGLDGAGLLAAHAVGAGQICHTRWWKAHSNSGVFAATTLPLWSISLLGQADQVAAFLEEIHRHTGKVALPAASAAADVPDLRPHDLTVLVCCYGFDTASAESLLERLRAYTVPLLKLDSFDLPDSISRLRQCGLMGGDGLTKEGLAFLRESNHWMFAEYLKGAA